MLAVFYNVELTPKRHVSISEQRVKFIGCMPIDLTNISEAIYSFLVFSRIVFIISFPTFVASANLGRKN